LYKKTYEYSIETHHLFVDFRAAYDSVKTGQLYRAMEDLGISQKLIKITKTTMMNSVTQIRIQSYISEPLKVNNGLRQGDPLACLLFNIALEKAVREANTQITGHIFHKSAQILAYADDVDIVARTKATLIEAFSALEKSSKKMGLKINQENTKIHTSNPQKRERKAPALTPLKVREYQFEQAETFTYLGTTVSTQNTIREEIKTRIMAANRSYFGLKSTLNLRTKAPGEVGILMNYTRCLNNQS
jgi:sorting nexin-29